MLVTEKELLRGKGYGVGGGGQAEAAEQRREPRSDKELCSSGPGGCGGREAGVQWGREAQPLLSPASRELGGGV